MKPELISLTPSEWRVMELLWQGDATLMEQVHALGEQAGWAKSTVSTMVRRMEDKGLIGHTEHGRAKLFHANLRREEVAIAETESLLSRVYHGSVGLMVNTLLQRGRLTQDDLEELQSILQQAEEETT